MVATSIHTCKPSVCAASARPVQVCCPHPAVVQVDQPARHAQQHAAAAVVPAQAALRPSAVLRHVLAEGSSKVAARHVLCRFVSVHVAHRICHKKRSFGAYQRNVALRQALWDECSTSIRTSLTSNICTQPASMSESMMQNSLLDSV